MKSRNSHNYIRPIASKSTSWCLWTSLDGPTSVLAHYWSSAFHSEFGIYSCRISGTQVKILINSKNEINHDSIQHSIQHLSVPSITSLFRDDVLLLVSICHPLDDRHLHCNIKSFDCRIFRRISPNCRVSFLKVDNRISWVPLFYSARASKYCHTS